MGRSARLLAVAIAVVAASTLTRTSWAGDDCPAEIAGADRFTLVLADSMSARKASVSYYQRDGGKAWRATGKPKPAMLGKSGLGWSWAHGALSGKNEPVKKEGDGRTPAGFFMLGGAFGSDAGDVPNYTHLKAGEHYCVDEPASPHYNTVVPKARAGKSVSGEDMARIGLYRQGLFVGYPTNAKRRGGSCIFIHVWRAANKPTVGCVALAETHVRELQAWSAKSATLIGILPKSAWERLRHCFPGL